MNKYVPDGRKGRSNNKGKKGKPKGWLLGPDNKEEDMQEDENDDWRKVPLRRDEQEAETQGW